MKVELDEVIKFLNSYEIAGNYIEERLDELEVALRAHFEGQEFKQACKSKMQDFHDYR